MSKYLDEVAKTLNAASLVNQGGRGMKVRTVIALLVVFWVTVFTIGYAFAGQGGWISLGGKVVFKEVFTAHAACVVVARGGAAVAVSCVPLPPVVPACTPPDSDACAGGG